MYADIVPKLRRWLSLQCFQTMCEKVGAHARLAAGRSAHHSHTFDNVACDTQFVRVFVPRYQSCVRKCRRVGELGGHQLRVDANAIKTILSAIPTMGAGSADDDEAGASIMYAPQCTPRASLRSRVLCVWSVQVHQLPG